MTLKALKFSIFPSLIFIILNLFKVITLPNIIFLVFGIFLIFLSVYDILYFEINDKVAISFITVFTILNLITNFINFGNSYFKFENIFAGILLSIFFAILVITTKGKIGGGEIRVGAIIGLMCGLKGSYVAIMSGIIFASIFGILFAIYKTRNNKLTFRENLKTRVPLIPFLSLGVIVAWIWGELIFRKLFFI